MEESQPGNQGRAHRGGAGRAGEARGEWGRPRAVKLRPRVQIQAQQARTGRPATAQAVQGSASQERVQRRRRIASDCPARGCPRDGGRDRHERPGVHHRAAGAGGAGADRPALEAGDVHGRPAEAGAAGWRESHRSRRGGRGGRSVRRGVLSDRSGQRVLTAGDHMEGRGVRQGGGRQRAG